MGWRLGSSALQTDKDCHSLPGLGFFLNCPLRHETQPSISLPSRPQPSNEDWHCLPPTLWF